MGGGIAKVIQSYRGGGITSVTLHSKGGSAKCHLV